MATTAPNAPGLDQGAVKALEEAGFASWPAQYTIADGQWRARLSPGLPFKRCNSVNCLSPQDGLDAARRLEKLSGLFTAHGLVPAIRLTPLTPAPLVRLVQAPCWTGPFGRSLVMRRELAKTSFTNFALPGRFEIFGTPEQNWLEGYQALCLPPSIRLSAVRAALAGIAGLVRFAHVMDKERPIAVGVGVVKESFTGLFGLAVAPEARRRGLGRALSLALMRWGHKEGARTAWLQVEAANEAALGLYTRLGFQPAYEYAYTRLSKQPS